MIANKLIENIFKSTFRARFGKIILYVAIVSFLIHLAFYFINTYLLTVHPDNLLASPINAIYTPFSFLLVYEAYLLLYYLPQSTSIYIGKQYEIITLILIRGIFKDITHLQFSEGIQIFSLNEKLWYDLITVFVVFALIFLFYRISRASNDSQDNTKRLAKKSEIQQFISAKKSLSFLLLLISIVLGIYSLANWILDASVHHDIESAIDLNSIFFDQFFTLLIISDVIILLLSLFYTDDYPKIIRNSSFVISTILLKLSFSANGILEQILIIVGVAFGVAMYALSNAFSKYISVSQEN